MSGRADVREWFDDETGRYGISVDVRNRQWGRLFGYRGSFDATWPEVAPGAVPAHILPIRQEPREGRVATSPGGGVREFSSSPPTIAAREWRAQQIRARPAVVA